MTRFLVFGVLALALDVLPFGRGCSCTPTTPVACTSSCDCPKDVAAPIRCPGEWTCAASKTCEYVCRDLCLEDGGCGNAAQTCQGSVCVVPAACP